MPNNKDFSNLTNKKEILVDVDGWIKPLIIEYAIGYHAENLSYFWRVKGTNHTFTIPVIRIDFLSQGNYASHFKEVLIQFREEYNQWKQQNFYTDWMKEYKQQYNNFIID